MAKKFYKPPKHFTGQNITTKTHFGSHSEMVVDHNPHNISLLDGEVLCKDDQGLYITNLNRIDSGLADPNRYSNPLLRRVGVEENKTEEVSLSS